MERAAAVVVVVMGARVGGGGGRVKPPAIKTKARFVFHTPL